MNTSYSISVLLFTILLPAFVVLEILQGSSKSIINSAFNGYEIVEREIVRVNGYSLIQCSIICKDTSPCLSFNYNKMTRACVLFDKDFTDLVATSRSLGVDWSYFHVIRDKEMKPVMCNAPYTPSEICSRYCLNYIHPEPWAAYAELESGCSTYPGGQMVIIDRQLKHHCVKELLVQEGAFYDNVYIQGKRNETTNLWTYNDGTAITYFNWNNDQPDMGVNEIYLAFMMMKGYLWDDVYDDKSVTHATVCQQT